jgi:hypothetical protein
MSEIQRQDDTPDPRSDGVPGIRAGKQPDQETSEKDPDTWQGLVWRLAQWATTLTPVQLINVSILICLVGAALWLIAGVVK